MSSRREVDAVSGSSQAGRQDASTADPSCSTGRRTESATPGLVRPCSPGRAHIGGCSRRGRPAQRLALLHSSDGAHTEAVLRTRRATNRAADLPGACLPACLRQWRKARTNLGAVPGSQVHQHAVAGLAGEAGVRQVVLPPEPSALPKHTVRAPIRPHHHRL